MSKYIDIFHQDFISRSGKNCCQKTGKKDASCSNNDTKKSASIFKRKNKNENALSGMIPGHNGCTKSCCSSKK